MLVIFFKYLCTNFIFIFLKKGTTEFRAPEVFGSRFKKSQGYNQKADSKILFKYNYFKNI